MCIRSFFSFSRRRRRQSAEPTVAEDFVIETKAPILLQTPRSSTTSQRPPKQRLRLPSSPTVPSASILQADEATTPKSAISLRFRFSKHSASMTSPSAAPVANSAASTAVNTPETSPNEKESFASERPASLATTEVGEPVLRHMESTESLFTAASYRPSQSSSQSSLFHYKSLPSLAGKAPIIPTLPTSTTPPPVPPRLHLTMPPTTTKIVQHKILPVIPLSAVEQSPNSCQPSSPERLGSPTTLRHSPSSPRRKKRSGSLNRRPTSSSGKPMPLPHNQGFRSPNDLKKQRSARSRRPKTAPTPIKPFAEIQAELDHPRTAITLDDDDDAEEEPPSPCPMGEDVETPIAVPRLSPRPVLPLLGADGRASPNVSVRTRLHPSRESVRLDPAARLDLDLTC